MSTSTWSITVRLSSGDRFVVEVPSTSTVGAAKTLIQASKSELTASRQRLVYKGRILDDDARLLRDYGIVDQATVFLVLSSASSSTNAGTSTARVPVAPPAPSPAPSSAVVPDRSASSSAPFPSPFGMPGAGLPGMGNPDSMREMMNHPMMQGLLDNPEMMQAALQMTLQTNPQMRQLLDSNPELRQVFNDPAMMQQAMQMMRNPAAMQQAMRSQELAMSQLENIPGGFSALSSMYRNLQEPLMEAQEMRSEPTNARPQQSSGEGATGAPMPNPWGSSSTQRTNSAAPSPSTVTSSAMTNPWGMPTAPTSPWSQGAMPGLGQMPNPDQVMQMLDNPIMMNMMQQMVDQNPDMIRQMMEAQNPMMRQMFQNNPEQANQFIRQMMNPQNMRNMLQMQRAMGGTMPGMPQPNAGLDFSNLLGSSSSPASAPPPLDFGAMLQQMQVGASPMAGGVPPMNFGSLLQQMQGTTGQQQQQQQQQHPADRYRSQLQSLRDMGFDDEQASLAALQQNHGNLNRAVDQLLMGPPVSAPSPEVVPSAPVSQPSSEDSNDATPKHAEDKKND